MLALAAQKMRKKLRETLLKLNRPGLLLMLELLLMLHSTTASRW